MNIKYNLRIVVGLIALLFTLQSCGDTTSSVEDALPVKLAFSGTADKSRIVGKAGDHFFIQVTAPQAWTLSISPEEAKQWLHVSELNGSAATGYGVSVRVDKNTEVLREATITLSSDGRSDVISISQQNSIVMGESARLEIPALAGTNNDYFITHKTKDGQVNYSLEYNVERYHSRWVAFTFDKQNSSRNYPIRTEAWSWDPMVPRQYSTETFFSGSGFSRGHLVASSDRYYSREANEQTFYYTNMSPQLDVHNSGIWSQLEQLVQNWGRSDAFRDVMYIVKGGTITDDKIDSQRVRGKIVVPKYYYMAIIVKKPNGKHHGIAFWTEHRRYERGTSPRSVTITIDELEKRTGIDFFHNFDDSIEQIVEAEAVANNWVGI